jgi:hypothetical protein
VGRGCDAASRLDPRLRTLLSATMETPVPGSPARGRSCDISSSLRLPIREKRSAKMETSVEGCRGSLGSKLTAAFTLGGHRQPWGSMKWRGRRTATGRYRGVSF